MKRLQFSAAFGGVLFVPSVERCIAALPLEMGVMAFSCQLVIELRWQAVGHPLKKLVRPTLSVEIRHRLLPLRKRRALMRAERRHGRGGD